jgi:hypothetical protein
MHAIRAQPILNAAVLLPALKPVPHARPRLGRGCFSSEAFLNAQIVLFKGV